MFAEESLWIRSAYQKIDFKGVKKAGNLGSSTLYFRTELQPHITLNVVKPLLERGVDVVNIDLKEEDGVDVIGDITSVSFGEQHVDEFDLLLCTNLLEHVSDINLVVTNLINATRPNGYVLITVPFKYRLHFDPIDNGFRPTPSEIAKLFVEGSSETIDSKIISIDSEQEYRVRRSRFPIWGHRERLMYFFGKRYQVSGILLRVIK